MNHLVILHAPYLDLIRAGIKTVESRLSRRRHPAATRCRAGDLLFLKRAGGDVEARATAGRITEVTNIPPGGVAELARRWSPTVAGSGPDDPYWLAKAGAHFALFIELTDVVPCHIPSRLFPRTLPWLSGWIPGQPTDGIIRAAMHDT